MMATGGDGRVLVVEDTRFFREIVCQAVAQRTGAEVVPAATFAETRAVFEDAHGTFDLALVDLTLPDAPDGEALHWLMARGVPCVVFSSRYSEEVRERLLAQNVIDYIIKDTPHSLDYLLALVQRLHRNRDTRVMVVDDLRSGREQVASLLARYQFQVCQAASGAEALDLLARHPDIRLVVTDYHMPGMDGVEMVRRMRATHAHDRLCIIGMSATGSGPLSARFIKCGANDFINRPFLHEEFLCRVMLNIRMLDMMDELVAVATKDALTGLHNRRFFFQATEAICAGAARDQLSVTVAMLDVDFFKQVNDTYGHDAGDAVLVRIADLLRRLCRKTDVVARFGGEEFVILAVNMDRAGLGAFFERLRAAVEAEEVVHGGQSIRVTASFGICHGMREGGLDGMLKAADRMLYRAKANGRNRVEIA